MRGIGKRWAPLLTCGLLCALLLSGCWTEAPVESANGLLGDQEPADQQEEVILSLIHI